MQRLVFEYSHEINPLKPMTSNEEYRAYDPNYGALILKDSALSDDKITLN